MEKNFYVKEGKHKIKLVNFENKNREEKIYEKKVEGENGYEFGRKIKLSWLVTQKLPLWANISNNGNKVQQILQYYLGVSKLVFAFINVDGG